MLMNYYNDSNDCDDYDYYDNFFDYDDFNDYDDYRTKAVILHDVAGHLSKFSQISFPTVYRDIANLIIILIIITVLLYLCDSIFIFCEIT